METRRCKACQCDYLPRNTQQHYCTNPDCQRQRKRRWAADKRQEPDYRDNQKRAQKAWSQRHPEYWRDYRRNHPAYTERNRAQQRVRAAGRGTLRDAVAKMDATPNEHPITTGIYRLLPVSDAMFAKSDARMVEITVLASPGADLTGHCKEMTRAP